MHFLINGNNSHFSCPNNRVIPNSENSVSFVLCLNRITVGCIACHAPTHGSPILPIIGPPTPASYKNVLIAVATWTCYRTRPRSWPRNRVVIGPGGGTLRIRIGDAAGNLSWTPQIPHFSVLSGLYGLV